MRHLRLGLLRAILIATAVCGAGSSFAEETSDHAALPPSTTYSEGGTKTCMKCHDDEHAVTIMSGPHGMAGDARTPAANKGCESCHGPAGEHSKKEKQFRAAQTFGGDDAAAEAEVCMGCHGKGDQQHFLTSEHSRSDVACNDCHKVHEREDKALNRLTQAEVCVDCHKDQKANMNKFSRHPIREGKVACTDCHNTHGSKGEHMLVASTVNETCYKCHAEKRGPFLFEHEPVQDDCSECHNPHGSVNDYLLKARPPFLCQECHNDTRHPGTVYANPNVAANNRAVGKACTNCHTDVHGSNHPAGVTFRR